MLVGAEVVIDNYTFPNIKDEPAQFGPRLPAEGVTGPLKAAVPIEGCAPLKNEYTEPWIALLERSAPPEQCSFVTKVVALCS